MSLRRKIFLGIGLILVVTTLAAFLVQQWILAENFARLEEKDMHANLTRVHKALTQELEQLESICADWARWDDTYEFVENANDAYLHSNLTDSALQNLRLNLIMFVHSSGRIVASKAYDLQHQREIPVPTSLSAHLAPPSILLEHRDLMRGTSGILTLPEGPLLVVALPILTSQDQGPSRGTLIFGRFLDEDKIARLGEILQLSLIARTWNDPYLPADFLTARTMLTTATPSYTRLFDDQVMAGYALVSDVYTKPALILRATMPRRFTQQGRLSQLYLTLLILASGSIAYALGMWGLDRLILARVENLARQVHRISERGQVARVAVTGSDELGTLEREINRMLDTISQSEERFRALVEHSSDLTLVLDRDATIRYASPSVQKILGYAPAELCGRSALEFVHPDDQSRAQEGLQHRLVTPGASDAVTLLRVRHCNGEWRTLEVMGTNLLAHPLIAGIVINCHDVTERERATHALHASEARWRTYIEQANDLIFALDTFGHITLVNRTLCDTLGYAAEELLGSSPLEFIAPEARVSTQDALARVLRGDTLDHFETIVLTRNQQRIVLEVRGHALRENHHIVETIHIARDITARKDTEELLRQQAQMYRALLENISDIVVLVDENRWIRFVTPSVAEVLGYSPSALIGSDLLDYAHPDERALLEETFQRALRDPWHSHRIEHRLQCSDGTWREFETIAHTYSREYGIDVVLSTRDITERKQASTALAAERNLLRTIIDAIPDAVFAKDTQGLFILNNTYHLQTLGAATQEQTLGKNLFEFHPPDLAEKYHADDQYVLTTGQPIIEKEQIYYHHARNQYRWHLITKVPLRDAQGNIIGLVGIGRDITERKKMEDELRRSRKEWQDIFNAIGHPTFILDPQHTIIAANRAVLKQLNKSEADVLGKSCYELFHASTCPPDTCPMQTLLRTGVMQTVEMEMQTVAGTFLVACTPVLDAQGRLEKIIHIATDITELKRVQAELQEANARFYALVEGIPDIVYLKDAQGHNLYVNRAYEEFAGTTRANIVGKRDDEIMPLDLAAQCAASDARVLESDSLVRVEESIIHREGKRVWYETIKNPVRDANGKIIGLVGVSRDITERKRAEALIREYSEHLEQLVEARTRELRDAQEQLVRQERLATLGQLAGSIAHELRSPLSAIKNAAYYLRTHLDRLDDDTREMLQILDEQVNTSARIIESLLDFARPKTPILKRVYLPYVIQAALEQCRVPDHVTLNWELAPHLPDVLADAAQMQIVFRNLITNAIQAMPNGGTLTIGVYTEGQTIFATLSDTGQGIPPEALDKIFQPLYTTKAKGIGLGLALCKLIVEAHDGKISVTSTVGKGSTFTITLPLDR